MIRAGLTPRACLTVWPPLATPLPALPADDLFELVWEDAEGRIHSVVADEPYEELAATLATARAAFVVPLAVDDRDPIASAVLPDPDGVLRARWT